MTILLATGIFPPDIGGPATYSALLAKELPKRGISVVVISFSKFMYMPRVLRHFAYFVELWRAAKSADLLFAQDPVSVGFPALIAARLRRKRLILKVVGDYAWEQGTLRGNVTSDVYTFASSRARKSLFVDILYKIQRFVAIHVDKIIVPSYYLKKIVIAWGVVDDKIHVVYNGFSQDMLPSAPKETLRQTLRFSGKLIISSGRMVPWKGFENLIAIMPRVLKKFPDTQLVICGDGPKRKHIEELIKVSSARKHIILTGSIEREILLSYLRAAHVFVLVSHYEGFSHQILEAMAVETPVIATDIGGNPELITSGVNGFLVPYANDDELLDKLLFVLRGNNAIQNMARQGKKREAFFTEDLMIEETVKILKA